MGVKSRCLIVSYGYFECMVHSDIIVGMWSSVVAVRSMDFVCIL
jgi:hypothetical protein